MISWHDTKSETLLKVNFLSETIRLIDTRRVTNPPGKRGLTEAIPWSSVIRAICDMITIRVNGKFGTN